MGNQTSYEPAEALADIVSILESLDIPYFLVGSFASGIRGEFRATNDIDLVCKFEKGKLDEFVNRAKQRFYCDEVAAPKAVAEKRSFNLIHENSFTKVDIFTSIDAFAENQFARATLVAIPGTAKAVRVSTAEYNILAKLRWYLKSDRQLSMQLRDVLAMLAVNQGSLDLEYLKYWADRLNLRPLLDEVLQSIRGEAQGS